MAAKNEAGEGVEVTYAGPYSEVEVVVDRGGGGVPARVEVVTKNRSLKVKPEVAMNLKLQGWKVPSISDDEMQAEQVRQGLKKEGES